MLWLTECLYCSEFLYHLQDGRVKCSRCHKKLSKNRINKILTLMQHFINDESALSVSKKEKISYVSVQKYYETFRHLSAKISEKEYETIRNKPCEYEEYFYLENSKKKKREAVFDAHNFLTFDYENHIYTLLMPSLVQYKQQFLEDGVDDAYLSEFSKFKRDSKIIKVSQRYNNIVKFWEYFESAVLKYKGIREPFFILFLKECEFKYNHTKKEALELLINEYFKD